MDLDMRPALTILLFLLGVGAAAAEAPSTETPNSGDRYAITPKDDGFLRLDRQTGAVAFCAMEKGVPACRLAADERAALEDEIARLRRENADLKAAKAGSPPPPGVSPLPKEEEFERALSLTERFFRRIIRLFKEEAPGDKS